MPILTEATANYILDVGDPTEDQYFKHFPQAKEALNKYPGACALLQKKHGLNKNGVHRTGFEIMVEKWKVTEPATGKEKFIYA